MATVKPPHTLGEGSGSDGEENISFEDYRRAVQKYPSDNTRLNKEFLVAYPSTTMAAFDQLSREDKINAAARARMLLSAGNKPVTTSVEHLIGDKVGDEFQSPSIGHEQAEEFVPKPVMPAADASIAQMLVLMQQQQAQQLTIMQQQMEQQRLASAQQIKLLADEL